jgi:hypothetical protein
MVTLTDKSEPLQVTFFSVYEAYISLNGILT